MQEIRRYDEVNAIANVPPFIKGVINLQGIIVPIVDQRIKFHIGYAKYDQLTARGIFGAQDFAITLNTQYISGLGTVDERMLILTDIIQNMMTAANMALVDETTH